MMIFCSGVMNSSMIISWSAWTQFSAMISGSGATLFSIRIPCFSRQSICDEDFRFNSDGVFADDFFVTRDLVFAEDSMRH